MEAAIKQEAKRLCNCSRFSTQTRLVSDHSFHVSGLIDQQTTRFRAEETFLGKISDRFLVTRSWEGERFPVTSWSESGSYMVQDSLVCYSPMLNKNQMNNSKTPEGLKRLGVQGRFNDPYCVLFL